MRTPTCEELGDVMAFTVGLGFTFGAKDLGLTKLQAKAQQGFSKVAQSLSTVTNQAKTAGNNLKGVVSRSVQSAVQQTASATSDLSLGLTAVSRSGAAAQKKIKTFAKGALSLAHTQMTMLNDKATEVGNTLQRGVTQGLKATRQGVVTTGAVLKSFSGKALSVTSEGLHNVWQMTRVGIPKALRVTRDGLKSLGETLKKFGETGDSAGGPDSPLSKGLAMLPKLAKGAADGIQQMAGKIKNAVSKISFDALGDKLESLKDKITGLPDQLKAGGTLTSSLEGQMTGMTKSAKAMGAQFGYTGKSLKDFTKEAVGLGYGLNIGEDAAGKAIHAWRQAGESLKAMGFEGPKDLAKFAEAYGVEASQLGDVGWRLQQELGFSADQIKKFTDTYVVLGQQTGDVPGSMSKMYADIDKLVTKKALGETSDQLLEFNTSTLALAAGFYETGQSADESISKAQAFAQTLTDSRKSWQNAFAGTNPEGLSSFMTGIAKLGGDTDMMMNSLKQGPMEFAESMQVMISQAGGWQKFMETAPESVNFLRAQLGDAFGDEARAEQFLLFLQNSKASTADMMKTVKGAQANMKKLGEEGFSTGLTLQDSFDRTEQAFIDRFRRISKKEASAFVRDTGKAFKTFGDDMSRTAAEGGPLGMFVKKLAEAHHLGSMAFIPQTLRPMITLFGTMTAQMLPALTGLGAMGLRFKHLANPALLATGAIVGFGAAFMASEKEFKSSIETFAQGGKALTQYKKDISSTEKELERLRASGMEGTEQFRDLEKSLGRKKERMALADQLATQTGLYKQQGSVLAKLEAERARALKSGKSTLALDQKIADAKAKFASEESKLSALRSGISDAAREDSKSRIKDAVNEGVAVVKGVVASIPSIVSEVVGFISRDAIPLLTDLWTQLEPGLAKGFATLKTLPYGEYAAKTWSFLEGVFTQAFGYVKDLDWAGILSGLSAGVRTAGTAIGSFLGSAVEYAGSMLNKVPWDKVLSGLDSMITPIGNKLFSAVGSAFDYLAGLDWTAAFTKVLDTVGGLIGGVFGGIFSGGKADGAVGSIGAGIGELLKKAVNASGSILLGLGEAIMVKIGQGFYNFGSWVANIDWAAVATSIGAGIKSLFSADTWVSAWDSLKSTLVNADWASVGKTVAGVLVLSMFAIGPIRAAIGGVFKSLFAGPTSVLKGIFATPDTKREVKDGFEKPMLEALVKYKGELVEAAKKSADALATALQQKMNAMAQVFRRAIETGWKQAEPFMRSTASRACASCECGGGSGGGGGMDMPGRDRRKNRRGGNNNRNRNTGGNNQNRQRNHTSDAPDRQRNYNSDSPDRPRNYNTDGPDRNRGSMGHPADADNLPRQRRPDTVFEAPSSRSPSSSSPHVNAPDAPRAGSGRTGAVAGLGLAAASLAGVNPLDALPGFGSDSAAGRLGNVATEEVVEEGVEKGTEKGAAKLAAKSAAKGAAAGAAEGGSAMARFLGKGAQAIPALGAGIMAIDAGMKSFTAISDILKKDMPTGEAVSSSLFAISGSVADTILMGIPSALDPDFVKDAGEGGQLLYKMATLDEKSLTQFGKGLGNVWEFGLNADAGVEAAAKAKQEAKASATATGFGEKALGKDSAATRGTLMNYAVLDEFLGKARTRGAGDEEALYKLTAEAEGIAKSLGLNEQTTKLLYRAVSDKTLAQALNSELDAKALTVLSSIEKSGEYTEKSVYNLRDAIKNDWGFTASKFGTEGLQSKAEEQAAIAADAPAKAERQAAFDRMLARSGAPSGASPMGVDPLNKFSAPSGAGQSLADSWNATGFGAIPPKRGAEKVADYFGAKADAESSKDIMSMTNAQIEASMKSEESLRSLQQAALSVDSTLVALQPMWNGVLTNLGTAWSGVAGNITTVNDQMNQALSPDKAALFATFFSSLWSGADGFFGQLESKVDTLFGNSISTDVVEDFKVSNEALAVFLEGFSLGLESTVEKAFVGGFSKAFGVVQTDAEEFTKNQLTLYDAFSTDLLGTFTTTWGQIIELTDTAGAVMEESIAGALAKVDLLRAEMSRAAELKASADVAYQATIISPDASIAEGSEEHLIYSVNNPDWYVKHHAPQVARMNSHLASMVALMERLVAGTPTSTPRAGNANSGDARKRLQALGIGDGTKP